MKIYISADIEGVNGICSWPETDASHPRYLEFKEQMTEEVRRACVGAKDAGASEIFVKDAHGSAMNINVKSLPEYVMLHRGWEGSVCSMMAGLDSGFTAVVFIGYHSPSRSNGNSLSHTMNTNIHHVKINGEIASEFLINSLYASYLNVPIAFLSGDLHLTEIVKKTNQNIEVVATKEGRGGAAVSRHPNLTNKEIEEKVNLSLRKDLSKNIVPLPQQFDIEIQYRKPIDAYNASFFPGCKLIGSDTISFHTNDYYQVLVMFKFNL
ncbi:MAG: M55 family metallopeptidase [Bacilli bacterium]|nr:M55 family metallopeptidase [Bacilli bacterium]MDD4076365.1 M55 family metallopeptidase [Bacilli bacterium]MDD4388681.1 M55 family metallopeptidase [Bacilli bacterium]